MFVYGLSGCGFESSCSHMGFFPVLADETDCCTACVILYITSPSNNSEKMVNKDCP